MYHLLHLKHVLQSFPLDIIEVSNTVAETHLLFCLCLRASAALHAHQEQCLSLAGSQGLLKKGTSWESYSGVLERRAHHIVEPLIQKQCGFHPGLGKVLHNQQDFGRSTRVCPSLLTCPMWVCRRHFIVSYAIIGGCFGSMVYWKPCMSWCQSLVHIVGSKSDLFSRKAILHKGGPFLTIFVHLCKEFLGVAKVSWEEITLVQCQQGCRLYIGLLG